MMIDWLYRRRDPAAVGTTLALIASAWVAVRLVPPTGEPPPRPQETLVRLEEMLPEPPAHPPPPPPPVVPPPPSPKPVVPNAPAPVPQAAPTPGPVAQEPAPSPAPPSPVAAPQPPAPPQPPASPPPPAPAPPPPPAAPARSADEGYRGELRGYLNGIKRYPNSREARQLRPQGTVKVWIEIDRAGQLLGAGIDTGSGSLILDNEALRTVRNGRYPPFPAEAFDGQGFHRFIVPIEYRVDSAG